MFATPRPLSKTNFCKQPKRNGSQRSSDLYIMLKLLKISSEDLIMVFQDIICAILPSIN